MASISISASLQTACSTSHHIITKKQQPKGRPGHSGAAKQVTNVVNVDVEGQKKVLNSPLKSATSNNGDDVSKQSLETEYPAPKFSDERWKKGTWDLNMFVKNGKMDWNALIVSEARRRKFLELYPETATNQEPVLFRSSVIPWWAWVTRSYLPEAELLNGRAAMVGFFMAYVVDALTGLDVVGQTGNFICKASVFVTVICIILFRRSEDLENLRKLADEATHYDKQWQASWQTQDEKSTTASEKTGNKM